MQRLQNSDLYLNYDLRIFTSQIRYLFFWQTKRIHEKLSEEFLAFRLRLERYFLMSLGEGKRLEKM